MIIFSELHGIKWKFWVAKIDKEDNRSILFFLRELFHFVEPIVESNCSWFCYKLISIVLSQTVSWYFDWIKESFLLSLRQVVRNSNHLKFIAKFVKFSNWVYFIQEGSCYLLRNKCFLLSLAFYFETQIILLSLRIAWSIFWLLLYIVRLLKSKVSVRCNNSVS